ncbi:MAG: replication initiation protein [Aminipila sp.]
MKEQNKKQKSLNSKTPLKRKKKAVLPVSQTYLKQPNTLTFAKYDFTVWQIKGLVIVMEEMQEAINELLDTKKNPVQLSLFKDKDIDVFQGVAEEKKPQALKKDIIQFKIPLKRFGVANSHYDKLRAALKAMSSLPVELSMSSNDGGRYTKFTSLFQAICPEPRVVEKEDGRVYTERVNHVYIEMEKGIANSLLNIDRGFTKYMKEIVMSQSSKYAIRLYIFISALKNRGGARISYAKFREMLGIEKNEYKDYNDFHKFVIRPAYEALHEKADVWFEMSEEYGGKSKAIPTHLLFKIIFPNIKVIEDTSFAVKREALERMFITHFEMAKSQTDDLLSYVNPDNYMLVVNHLHRISDYIKVHSDTVYSKADYAYQSFLSEFQKDLD